MTRSLSRLLATTGAMILLSGCQIFSGHHSTHAGRLTPRQQQVAATMFTQQGRELLHRGNNGRAIEAFNLALATGEDPALAYNGLGVAYARLDRADLAYRFFRKAAMSDPGNPMFAQNLTNLIESPRFATMLARRERAPSIAADDAPRHGAAAPSVLTPGKLHRDGNRQFSLVTAPAAPAARTAGRDLAISDCPSLRTGPGKRACPSAVLPRTGSGRIEAPGLGIAVSPGSKALSATSGEALVPDAEDRRKTISLPDGPAPTGQSAEASRDVRLVAETVF